MKIVLEYENGDSLVIENNKDNVVISKLGTASDTIDLTKKCKVALIQA